MNKAEQNLHLEFIQIDYRNIERELFRKLVSLVLDLVNVVCDGGAKRIK